MLASTLKYFRSIVLITCTLLANTLQAGNVIRTDGVALMTSTLDKDIYRTRAIENAFQNFDFPQHDFENVLKDHMCSHYRQFPNIYSEK